jgi:hypothetical protein
MPRLVKTLAALGAVLLLLAPMPAAASAPVRLKSPADGEILPAGGRVWLEWAPATGFEELAYVHEWEAFISLDGGQTFPVQLTPHLDLEQRGAVVTLPLRASKEVRLLLRFGDERRERLVVLDAQFASSYGRPTVSLPPAGGLDPDRAGGGEAEVDPAADGRWGDGVRLVPLSAVLEGSSGSPGIEAHPGHVIPAVHETLEGGHGVHGLTRLTHGCAAEPCRHGARRRALPPPAQLDPRRQTTRQNE